MRVTRHNARGAKHSSNGFHAKHNDRDFDMSKADNINAEMTKNNFYYNCFDGWYQATEKDNKKSFEEAEKAYYGIHFMNMYQGQINRNNASGNKKRNKDFDEWRKSKRYCPEETYMQIGNVDGHIDAKLFAQISRDYVQAEMDWAKAHNDCFVILDVANQYDEAVPQVHLRKVWRSVSANGVEEIGQATALERAGVELPNPDKEVGNKNNRKMTFDREMREKLFEICEHYGVQITREPIKDAEHDMSKNKLLVKKNANLQAENKKLLSANKQIRKDGKELNIQYKKLKKNVADKKTELDDIKNQIAEQKQTMKETMENWTNLQKQVAIEIARKQKQRNDNLIETIDKPVEFEKQTSVTKDCEY